MTSRLFPAAAAAAAAACLALPSGAKADILGSPTPIVPQYGQALMGGDDAGAQIALPFSFGFYGATYSHLNISSNGYVTLTSGALDLGVDDWKPAIGSFLNGPARIAPEWFDMVSLTYVDKSVAGRLRVTWLAEEYQQSTLYLTQLDLFSDGRISFAYATGAPNGAVLSGISAGGGAADPGSTSFAGADLYAGGSAVYSLSDPGAFDGRYRVTFTPYSGGYRVTTSLQSLADPAPLPEWPAEPPGGGNPPVTGVPEPASWALMILGFGAAGATLRTRRRVAG